MYFHLYILIIINPTTCHYSSDDVILYDINKENKISFGADIFTQGKLEYFSSINAFINYYILIGLQVNFIYILLNEKIYHKLYYINCDIIHFSDFLN